MSIEVNSGEKKTSHWLDGKGVAKQNIVMGRHLAYWLNHSPRRMLHSMAYYKFAAKMIGGGKGVLDIGCGEGLGTWLLFKECGAACGIDLDQNAIGRAQQNWGGSVDFVCGDLFETMSLSERYDAIVLFDVIEHIMPDHVNKFYDAIQRLLKPHGVVIMGTPNSTAAKYASAITNAGHVNLYTGERLEEEMRQIFKHVFMFGANDEVVHTGFMPMAHYLICVACGKTT